MSEQLAEREQRILALEARMPRHGGAKEEAIRVELSLTPARYYLLLDRLIDTDVALSHDPLLVRRLRRVRDEGARRRADRISGATG